MWPNLSYYSSIYMKGLRGKNQSPECKAVILSAEHLSPSATNSTSVWGNRVDSSLSLQSQAAGLQIRNLCRVKALTKESRRLAAGFLSPWSEFLVRSCGIGGQSGAGEKFSPSTLVSSASLISSNTPYLSIIT